MKKDKKLIPKGEYCYDENGTCPYWSLKEGRDEQENGWCSYMDKGDLEIAEDNYDLAKVEQDGVVLSNDEVPYFIFIGLLWDQCKECGINIEEDEQ